MHESHWLHGDRPALRSLRLTRRKQKQQTNKTYAYQKKIGLLLAKAESTYNTDPTPTAAANAIAVVRGQVGFEPQSDAVVREILDGGLSTIPGDNALPRVKLTFTVELVGNRVDGTQADIAVGFPHHSFPRRHFLRRPPLESRWRHARRPGLPWRRPPLAA